MRNSFRSWLLGLLERGLSLPSGDEAEVPAASLTRVPLDQLEHRQEAHSGDNQSGFQKGTTGMKMLGVWPRWASVQLSSAFETA